MDRGIRRSRATIRIKRCSKGEGITAKVHLKWQKVHRSTVLSNRMNVVLQTLVRRETSYLRII
jgi:hypothetical protein